MLKVHKRNLRKSLECHFFQCRCTVCMRRIFKKGISKDFRKLFIARDTFFPEISHFLSKTHTVLQCQDSVTSRDLCMYFSYTKHGSLKFITFHDFRYIICHVRFQTFPFSKEHILFVTD